MSYPPAALRLDLVHKSLAAGVPGCSACVRVLAGASLRAAPGEMVAITGARGAGKTTLLLCAAGMLRPDAGMVTWRDGAADPAARAYLRGGDLAAASRSARLLLVDDADGHEPALAALRARGITVVAAVRRAERLASLGARVLALHDGRLERAASPGAARRSARVAEQ